MATTFSITYHKNDGSGITWSNATFSKGTADAITSVGLNWDGSGEDWSRDGYNFVEWNTSADGSGTSLQPSDLPSGRDIVLYAIWQEAVSTPPVDILLGNTSIATITVTGSVTLATAGTYLADDITITYTP